MSLRYLTTSLLLLAATAVVSLGIGLAWIYALARLGLYQ